MRESEIYLHPPTIQLAKTFPPPTHLPKTITSPLLSRLLIHQVSPSAQPEGHTRIGAAHQRKPPPQPPTPPPPSPLIQQFKLPAHLRPPHAFTRLRDAFALHARFLDAEVAVHAAAGDDEEERCADGEGPAGAGAGAGFLDGAVGAVGGGGGEGAEEEVAGEG